MLGIPTHRKSCSQSFELRRPGRIQTRSPKGNKPHQIHSSRDCWFVRDFYSIAVWLWRWHTQFLAFDSEEEKIYFFFIQISQTWWAATQDERKDQNMFSKTPWDILTRGSLIRTQHTRQNSICRFLNPGDQRKTSCPDSQDFGLV